MNCPCGGQQKQCTKCGAMLCGSSNQGGTCRKGNACPNAGRCPRCGGSVKNV
jgi:hypothetical protein